MRTKTKRSALRRPTAGQAAFAIVNALILGLTGIGTIYPFLNLLAVSLNDSLDTLRGGIYLLPRMFTWSNYEVIFLNENLFRSTVNSVIRTVVGTGASVIATAMLAYALSQSEFIFRRVFMTILIISMYVNGGLIPTYLLIKNMHMTNSFLVYLLPLLISAFNVIIMRSFIMQLPAGLMESAKIDGANDVQVLFRIVMPVSLPVIATVTMFVAVGHWNSWFDNYLYVSDPKKSVLQYELMKILMSSVVEVTSSASGHLNEAKLKATSPEAIRAAMTMLVTLPILFVYPFLQKYFIQGMTIGAVKE